MFEDRFNLLYCIFLLVTLFVPFGAAPGSSSYTSSVGWSISVTLFAILWVYRIPSSLEQGGFVFGPEYWNVSLIFAFPSMIFAFLVLLHVKGKISRGYTVLGGIFSLIWPGGFMLVTGLYALLNGALVYIGPIPIQFLFGLILLRYYSPKEEKSFPLISDESSWWNEDNDSVEETSMTNQNL
ncbi:MAG: hypothetical protein ACFFF4_08550 [Candidatus Thorarchaeota archaeon]